MSYFANVIKKISVIYSFFTSKSVDSRRHFSDGKKVDPRTPTNISDSLSFRSPLKIIFSPLQSAGDLHMSD